MAKFVIVRYVIIIVGVILVFNFLTITMVIRKLILKLLSPFSLIIIVLGFPSHL